jgi:hypothetical protein
MEYNFYDIQNTESLGSIREHGHITSGLSTSTISRYDSFNYDCLYTMRLQKSVTVASRDGYNVWNSVRRKFVSLNTSRTG